MIAHPSSKSTGKNRPAYDFLNSTFAETKIGVWVEMMMTSRHGNFSSSFSTKRPFYCLFSSFHFSSGHPLQLVLFASTFLIDGDFGQEFTSFVQVPVLSRSFAVGWRVIIENVLRAVNSARRWGGTASKDRRGNAQRNQ